jgi:iron complex transport system substrate-binding protein
VTRLPALTHPKFDPEGSSAEVDERVKKLLAEALSVYRVDVDLLRSAKPDVVVTQSQCEVCAVSLRDVELALADWVGGAPPRIISLAPFSLSDVMADIERVAVELGEAERGMQLVGGLSQRMTAIEHQASRIGTRPAIASIEWIDPLMAGANWMPELITMAGGRSLFGVAGQHSPKIKFDDLVAKDPDLILLSPCGFNLDRTAAELGTLTKKSQWPSLKAVQHRQVYLADGNQYFNRPGPRIVESLEILAEIIHPQIFHFGHEGSGWRRL